MSELDKLVDLINAGRSNEKLQPLYAILGLNELYWVRVLCQLALYHPLTGPLFDLGNINPETITFVKDSSADNKLLIYGQNGSPGTVHPTNVSTAWPYDPYATLTYVSAGKGLVSWFGREETVDCVVDEGRLIVNWPKESGVRGDIDTSEKSWEPGTQFKFLTPLSYPVQFVAQQLKTSNEVFTLCEEVDYAAELVHADTELETVAIAVAVLYKHLS